MKNGKDDQTTWSYKDWYAKHAAELAEKRRQRYENDPEYKQKVLEQNRAYREKKSAEAKKIPKPRVRIPRHRKPVAINVPINGVLTLKQLVHVGYFARAISRSVPTVHQWERSGVLPRTPFTLVGRNKQERLYTSEMIAVVRSAMEARSGTISISDRTFHEEIVNGWKGIGVDIDATLEIGENDGKVANG
jgi:hypothetical protein